MVRCYKFEWLQTVHLYMCPTILTLSFTLVNEILSKERTESPVSPQDGKSGKGNPEVIILGSFITCTCHLANKCSSLSLHSLYSPAEITRP